MASRGRGRGGRGRGGGHGFLSDSRDVGDKSTQLVEQPPPLFPPLEHRPVPLLKSSEEEYMMALKKDFVGFLRDHVSLNNANFKANFDWSRVPEELRPKKKGSSVKKGSAAKRQRNIDLSRLDALMVAEEKLHGDDDEVGNDNDNEGNNTKTDDEDENEDEEKEEEKLEDDDEMDDGTDYVNNYFDNGEGFDDDDDGNRDGPIY